MTSIRRQVREHRQESRFKGQREDSDGEEDEDPVAEMENCNRTTTHSATESNTTSRRAATKSLRKAIQGTKVQFAPRCPCHDVDCRDEDHSDASSWASENYNPCHDLLESGDEDGVQEDWIIDKRFSPDQEEEIEAPNRISKVRIDLAAELFDFDDYERQVEWNDNEKLEEERKLTAEYDKFLKDIGCDGVDSLAWGSTFSKKWKSSRACVVEVEKTVARSNMRVGNSEANIGKMSSTI